MAERQEAHPLVVLVLGDDRVVAADGVDDAGVRMHRALGLAGRARRVDQDRQVFGPARGDAPVELARVRLAVAAAELAQGGEREHAIVVEVAQAFGVEDDDPGEPRQPRAHGERLVELLVVLDEQDPAARVERQVLDLRRRVGRVDAIRDAAAREHGEVGEDPVDDGVGKNRGAIAGSEAERDQAVADLAHGLGGSRPGPVLPNAELFLAHQDAPAALGGGVPEQRRHRLAGHDDVVARHQAGGGVPEVAHESRPVIATSSSSSIAARRARRRP